MIGLPVRRRALGSPQERRDGLRASTYLPPAPRASGRVLGRAYSVLRSQWVEALGDPWAAHGGSLRFQWVEPLFRISPDA